MNRVAIDLGFIQIYWYSITMLLGIILGDFIAVKEIKRHKMDSLNFQNMLFYAIIFGLLGARIYYVLFNLDYYSMYPCEIFAIWHGGLAIHGAIIAAVITIVIYCKKNNLSILKILDICSLGLIIGQVIGRWGNFFNGEAHGCIVSLSFLESLHLPKFIINGMYIDGNYYHPTFLYESVFNLIGFIILMLLRKNKKLKEGMLLSLYLIWYSVVRFFVEGLRTDSLMLGSLRQAQVISIVMFIVGIILFIKSFNGKLYNKESK